MTMSMLKTAAHAQNLCAFISLTLRLIYTWFVNQNITFSVHSLFDLVFSLFDLDKFHVSEFCRYIIGDCPSLVRNIAENWL